MNAAAAAALYEAERKGVRQLIGLLYDGKGGHCAMGVIRELDTAICDQMYEERHDGSCPLCAECNWCATEGLLVAHLNNDHRLTFSEIARKLGPDSV